MHGTLCLKFCRLQPTQKQKQKEGLLTQTNTCFVDPKSVFGKADGEAADSSQMIDEIHYNETMAFGIKTLAQNQCSITL